MDYKQDLRKQFEKSGLLENLKVQMRYKLLEKLQKQKKDNQEGNDTERDYEDNNRLEYKVIVSLIDDFLDYHQLNYSRSVFLPEVKIEILNRESLQKMVGCEQNKQKCVMEQMVFEKVERKGKERDSYNACTQTLFNDSVQCLEEKFQRIEEEHQKKQQLRSKNSNGIGIIDQMDVYKKQLEDEFRLDLERELTRIRQVEMAQVKIQESQKNRLEMEKYREQMEMQYYAKLEQLNRREEESRNKRERSVQESNEQSYYKRQEIERRYEELERLEEQNRNSKHMLEKEREMIRIKGEMEIKELRRERTQLEDEKQKMQDRKKYELEQGRLQVERELQGDRENVEQKQRLLNKEIVSVEALKDNNTFLLDQNKQLQLDKQHMDDKLQESKRKRREQEDQNRVYKEQSYNMQESIRRDQTLMKTYQQQLELKKQELEYYKDTVEQNQTLVENQKSITRSAQVDNQNMIQNYQMKIEQLESEMRERQETDNALRDRVEIGNDGLGEDDGLEIRDRKNQDNINKARHQMDQWRQQRDQELNRLQA